MPKGRDSEIMGFIPTAKGCAACTGTPSGLRAGPPGACTDAPVSTKAKMAVDFEFLQLSVVGLLHFFGKGVTDFGKDWLFVPVKRV